MIRMILEGCAPIRKEIRNATLDAGIQFRYLGILQTNFLSFLLLRGFVSEE
jgi:hypothetical protein